MGKKNSVNQLNEKWRRNLFLIYDFILSPTVIFPKLIK